MNYMRLLGYTCAYLNILRINIHMFAHICAFWNRMYMHLFEPMYIHVVIWNISRMYIHLFEHTCAYLKPYVHALV
jgi:hypothetical protein